MTCVKLVGGAAVVAFVGFALVGGGGDAVGQNDPRKGRSGSLRPIDPRDPAGAELTGEWKVKTVETNGAPLLTAEGLKKARVVFEAGRAELTGFQFGVVGHFAFTLDPKQTPKAIDITPADGPLQGKKLVGVYVARETEIRICVRVEQTERGRPVGFVTSGGAGLYTMILERPAPAPDPDTRGRGLSARLVPRPRDVFLEVWNDGAEVAVTFHSASLRAGLIAPGDVPRPATDVALPRGGPDPTAVVPAGGYVAFPVSGRAADGWRGLELRVGRQGWRFPPGERCRFAGRVEMSVSTPADRALPGLPPRKLELDLVPVPFVVE